MTLPPDSTPRDDPPRTSTPREATPRLGRGLAALFGDTAQAAAAGNGVTPVAIGALEPDARQPRRAMDEAALAGLAESIRRNGILQPLLARPHPSAAGRYLIIAGERRWRAAALAGLTELPVLVRGLDEASALAAALVENLQREDLNPIEEAEGYNRLIGEFRMTQELLSSSVGKSRSHIANTLRLLHLPEAVREALRAGQLSAGHARALLGHPDPAQAALQVIARGLNVRQTEKLTDAAVEPGPRPPKQKKDTDTAAIERDIGARLGLRAEIVDRGGQGQLRLHYRTLDQLDNLIARLMRD